MEFLVLVVIAIVWQVIKALTQAPPPRPPQQQQPAKRIVVPEHKPEQTLDVKVVSVPQYPQFTYEDEEVLEVLEVGETEGLPDSDSLTMDEVVSGIIMIEVLGKPRSQNPHMIASRRN